MKLLAKDPAKRRAEILWLIYSPVWMLAVLLVQVTGCLRAWRDPAMLLFGVALALPPWLLPLLPGLSAEASVPLRRRYAVRAMTFITLLAFVQNDFGAQFFFRVLGMQYHFPVHLVLHGTPLFLYFMTVAYFTTYYAGMQVLWRACQHIAHGWAARILSLFVLSYLTAFGETYFMANDRLREYFSYADRHFVLTRGSLCYGTVFFITLPLVYRLDEDPRKQQVPLAQVVWEALGANMLILICYEVYAYALAA